MAKRDHWGGKLGFILAAAGGAVGLGNIWKFPYMAGDNGGSSFVLVYLLSILLVGIPALIAEISLGRISHSNAVTCMQQLGQQCQSRLPWHCLGWLGSLTLVLVLSFYSVVAGWSLIYIFYASTGVFMQASASQVQNLWHDFLHNPLLMLIGHSAFLLGTMLVVVRGVTRGLEQASKWMTPSLFVILVLLAIYAGVTGNLRDALHFLFAFNWHKITPHVVIDALGHAFFTLAIGAGCMLVYGVYLPPTTRLFGAISIITTLDVLVAFLSGLAIFPLVFHYHLPTAGGPGLMFEVLPIAFAHMPFGQLVSVCFFILLLFAAWTSSISMAEPLVLLLIEYFQLTRRAATWLIGWVVWALGSVALLSFNYLSDVHIFHRWGIFDAMTDLATNILLPLGGLGFVVFAGWFLDAKMLKPIISKNPKIAALFIFLLRYVSPLGIIIILLDGIS